MGYRQSGKTTRLIERAIEWQGLNTGNVFVTGGFIQWSAQLFDVCRASGLIDFVAVRNINQLRGIFGGLLLVDELGYLDLRQLDAFRFITEHAQCDVIATYDITPKPFNLSKIEINPKHLKTGSKRADSVV